MTRISLTLTAVLALASTAALAEIDPQALADSYAAQGYSNIEVTVGAADVKLEARSGSTQIEVVYDRETGEILSQESEQSGWRHMIESTFRHRHGADDDGTEDGDDDHGRHGADDGEGHDAGDDHGGDDD